MDKRQMIQIPGETIKKLNEVERTRPDLTGYSVSKKVHSLLQEKIAEVLKKPTQPSPGEWEEYVREAFPLCVIAPHAIGTVRFSEELIGEPYTKFLIANEYNKGWWCNYKEDIHNVGEYLLKKLSDSNELQEKFAQHEKAHAEASEFCDRIKKTPLPQITDNELCELYKQTQETLMKYFALSFDIDAIDIVLEERMKKECEKLWQGKEFNEKYSLLTTPLSTSNVNEEQTLIYQAVIAVKEEGAQEILKEIIKGGPASGIEARAPKLNKILNELCKGFWWASMSWSTHIEKTRQDFAKEIEKTLAMEEPEEQLQRIKELNEKIAQEKAQLVGQLSTLAKNYLEIFEQYAIIHEKRKIIQMKGTFIINNFLLEAGRRYGYNFEHLRWFWPEEIEGLLRTGRINIEKGQERQGLFFTIVHKNWIEEQTGEMAIIRRKEELSRGMMSVKNFKGTIASPGRITGTVKVCYSSIDAKNKIKEGDILVVGMTTPDYVPAMKLAGAIITDEGGITAHAAIISRELHKPCIVGTKIATKTLNDGDTIEVNANHGVVTVLKRKE
jgi:phosphohistidine swiveling domain-containing protein